MKNIKLTHDIHTHTFLSLCADKEKAIPSEYIKNAAEGGLELLGFSDHFWDEAVAGASPWYSSQNTVHVKRLLETVDFSKQESIKILFGVEAEYANGTLGMSRKGAESFDYILVAHSHTHMKGFVLPDDCDTYEKHAKYLSDSFYNLVNHPLNDVITGIVHPLIPCGKKGEEFIQIVSKLDRVKLNEAFCAAAENNIKLELNASCLVSMDASSLELISEFYNNAYKRGCRFFTGGDKHAAVAPAADSLYKLGDIAEKFGVTICEANEVVEKKRK